MSFLMSVFSFASSGVIPKSIDYHPELPLELGRNFSPMDPLRSLPKCLEFNSTQSNVHSNSSAVSEGEKSDQAAQTTMNFYLVENWSDYRTVVGMSANMDAHFLGFGVSGSNSFNYNSQNTRNDLRVVLKVETTYQNEFVGVPQLSTYAQQLIDQNEYQRLVDICGSHYVGAVQRHSMISVLIHIKNVDASVYNEIKTSAGAKGSILGLISFGGNVSLNSEFNNKKTKHNQIETSVFIRGGTGLNQVNALVKSLFNGKNNLDVIAEGVKSVLAGFNQTNAVPKKYFVTAIPSIPTSFHKNHFSKKYDRMLEAIGEKYRNFELAQAYVNDLVNLDHPNAVVFSDEDRFYLDYEKKEVAGLLEEIMDIHELCLSSKDEGWEYNCKIDQIQLPQYTQEAVDFYKNT